jgi:hypothetical protein
VNSSEVEEDEYQEATQIKHRVYHLMKANEAPRLSFKCGGSVKFMGQWRCVAEGHLSHDAVGYFQSGT